MATETAEPTTKKKPLNLKVDFVNGKATYSLPERERARLESARELCGLLANVADLNPEATEAAVKIAELLGMFSD